MKMQRCTKSFHMLAVLACVVASWAIAAAQTATQPEWRTTDDRWYSLEFGGGKAGWSNETTQTDGTNLRSLTQMQMKIGRGGVAVEIAITSSFTETADGKPVALEMNQKTSMQNVITRWEFLDDHMTEITMSGGREMKKDKPLPKGNWLTPMAAERFSVAQRKAGSKEFSFQTIDPQGGAELLTMTVTNAGAEDIDVDGKPTHVTVWKTKTTMQGPMGQTDISGLEKINAENQSEYEETSLAGLGKMITRLTTKEKAQGGDGAEVPELMIQTFIKPDKPIADSMKATSAKLRIRTREGTMSKLPSAGAQRVEPAEDGKSALLIIDINHNLPAPNDELNGAEFIEGSAMLDVNDDLVQKLAARAVKDAGDDEMKRAEALRAFVRKHISRKGMATAFASASETARTKTGDCSEHGVLLCALMRANKIPARVATGLIYAEAFAGESGIFGWHMWTQALIDRQWVDFDATIPQRYNATHILTGVSSLKDGLSAGDMAPLLKLIGNLDVEVIEVKYE